MSLTELKLPNGLAVACVDEAEAAVLFREIFTEQCWLQNGLELPPGSTVIDAGANIGIAALFFHTICPGVSVHCFEPAPVPFEALRANMRAHGVAGTVNNRGLADRDGFAALTYYPRTTSMSGLAADETRDGELMAIFLRNSGFTAEEAAEFVEGRHEGVQIDCQVGTLSSEIKRLEIEQVDLLKLDVERSELAVLKGIEDVHWPLIRQVAAEVDAGDARLDGFKGILAARGFTVHVTQNELLAGTEMYDVIGIRV